MINFILVVYRYADYVKRMVATPQYLPHKNTVFLKSVSISPIPIFNKARYSRNYYYLFLSKIQKTVVNVRQKITP